MIVNSQKTQKIAASCGADFGGLLPRHDHTPNGAAFSPDLVIVKPCAWCFPGDTFFDRFPETRGEFSLSYGICPRHYELFLQTISPPPKQRGGRFWDRSNETDMRKELK